MDDFAQKSHLVHVKMCLVSTSEWRAWP